MFKDEKEVKRVIRVERGIKSCDVVLLWFNILENGGKWKVKVVREGKGRKEFEERMKRRINI